MSRAELAKSLFVEALGFMSSGEYEHAEHKLREAHALVPDRISVLVNLSAALLRQDKLSDARHYVELALGLDAGVAQAWLNLGSCHLRERDFARALQCYEKASDLDPNYFEAWLNRGIALNALTRSEEALDAYDKAIVLSPDSAEALASRAVTLTNLKRYPEAQADQERAFALKPDLPFLRGDQLEVRMLTCQWTDFHAICRDLCDAVDRNVSACRPFVMLSIPSSPAQQKKCAQRYTADLYPRDGSLGELPARSNGGKIRLGYFSADFYSHPMPGLAAEVFERHDRSRFEVMAFSFGASPRDAMRRRLEAGFDRFHELRSQHSRAIAEFARHLQIDIAVDLMGFTQHSRTEIFALRAAPVQVNFLGYPGTLGAPYIDYLIADHVLISSKEREHYSEKIAYLPHTYQPNDRHRQISDETPSRNEEGLPEDAFVFCCFNNNYKITPEVFAVWMRLLGKVKGSVLWLLEDNAYAAHNLRTEAQRRGISADRLHFARRVPSAQHLARHRLADLFLDTRPYNAHTTASDALWAGLPLLTCPADTFPSRVASSLLRAIGLPELVTGSLHEYEETALALARDAHFLAALRSKLAEHRATHPLFDAPTFTSHLEAAYTEMHRRSQAGLAPEHIDVPA